MPSPKDQDDSLAAALSKEISILHDAHSCSICHGLLSAPVSLPCSHIFCSECARRHLRNKSTCPQPVCRKPSTYMQLTPLRAYDVALEPLRRSAQKVEPLKLGTESRLIFLSRKTSTRAQLLERLRSHNVPTHGGTDVIANRYNDFVVRWNANLDAGMPKSKKAIVAVVMAAEIEAAKVPKRPRATSSFFKKITSQDSTGDDEIPVQGDDFATLVKKTRARMEKKRKLVTVADDQNRKKLICLDTVGHNQKKDLESQATVINDPTKSLDNISRPSANGMSLEPVGVQEESNGVLDVSRDGMSSQFDNNSPAVATRIEPAGLAVHYNVCSVDVVNEDVNRVLASNLTQTDRRIRVESQNTNALLSQAPLWSQMTPEKRALPSEESHANSTLPYDGKAIPTSAPTKALSRVQNAQDTSGALSNQKVGQQEEPATKGINAGPVTTERLKARSPPPSLAANERNINKDLPGSMAPSLEPGDSQLETKKEENTHRDVVRGVCNLSSTEVTPTKAQLERAERNRLVALERRRRFYEQNELRQMRQPDL